MQAMEAELHQITSPVEPTDEVHSVWSSVRSAEGTLRTALVPEALKVRLCEDLPGLGEEDGWKLMKSLPLSRSKRRTLHASKQWVVSLGSGPYQAQDPIRQWCEERTTVFTS